LAKFINSKAIELLGILKPTYPVLDESIFIVGNFYSITLLIFYLLIITLYLYLLKTLVLA
jgi:hypothetical protein